MVRIHVQLVVRFYLKLTIKYFNNLSIGCVISESIIFCKSATAFVFHSSKSSNFKPFALTLILGVLKLWSNIYFYTYSILAKIIYANESVVNHLENCRNYLENKRWFLYSVLKRQTDMRNVGRINGRHKSIFGKTKYEFPQLGFRATTIRMVIGRAIPFPFLYLSTALFISFFASFFCVDESFAKRG